MSAAERRDPGHETWRRLQERMRYELLLMLYHASGGSPDHEVGAWRFAQDLGVWEEEVWNAFVWLQQAGFARIYRPGPVVSITMAGIRYVEHDARRRRTIRGIAPPDPPAEP